jgi:hypothetical protein
LGLLLPGLLLFAGGALLAISPPRAIKVVQSLRFVPVKPHPSPHDVAVRRISGVMLAVAGIVLGIAVMVTG